MNRIKVSSSNIKSIGYDQKTQTLEVEFIKGGIYQYLGVPLSVYQGLMAANSHGSYLDQHIKKANYNYRQVG